ncbi:MAG: hypothetical protein ABIJ26_05470 [Candidatus Margulisiibacteriota bacterium]
MSGKIKHLYLGYFQFRHKTYIERAHAYTKGQAYLIFCRRIAQKQGVDLWLVLEHFKASPDAYRVDLEIEWKEVER